RNDIVFFALYKVHIDYNGEITDEILQAALEIITEQLKERRKSDK
ncbi:hypothetical protein P9E03_12190, partial [Bacillus mojavensis]|nr:hypothetical protein [Bacillus mojavensis]